jgi:hypothetical protein
MLFDSGLDNVTILDPYLLNARKKCITYLLSLESKMFPEYYLQPYTYCKKGTDKAG